MTHLPTRQNMEFSLAPAAPERDCGKYRVRDLGLVQLDDYPIDGVYDWGNCILKIGDVYKMWWTRACPQDTVWYAESRDMKHWTNEHMVFKIRRNTRWIKGMLGWSDVVWVDGVYYMFFEAPATIDEIGEYNNNIFVATSEDGKHFTMYPSDEDPQPILRTPEDIALHQRTYGIGQPDVSYVNGEFRLYYTDAANRPYGTRVVCSKDPFRFDNDVTSHPLIMNATGLSARYHPLTGKYYTLVSVNPRRFDPSRPDGDANFLVESADGVHFEYSDVADVCRYCTPLTDTSVSIGRGYADFVSDAHGQLAGRTIYLISKTGQPAGPGRDHRTTHNTWDCFLQAVNPSEFREEPILLPDGRPASDENMDGYRDIRAVWRLCSLHAPRWAGSFAQADAAVIESVCFNGTECEITNARGRAKLCWDDGSLYLRLEVTGRCPDGVCGGRMIDRDGVTVFLNGDGSAERYAGPPNCVRDDLGYEPLGNRVTAACAKVTLGTDGSSDCGAETETELLPEGWRLSARIPWPAAVRPYVKPGARLGLDLRINVAEGGKGCASVYWSDYAGYSDDFLDRYGELILE